MEVGALIFSVIVPFHNEEDYIQSCVESLLSQEFPPEQYELIFVDNGSTDRSREIVAKYSKITLLRENIINVYRARNQGLRNAQGQFIAFTDADCKVSTQWLKNIQAGFLSTGADIVLGPRYFAHTNSRILEIFQNYENSKIEYLIKNKINNYLYGYANNMAIRSDVFNAIGLFDEWPIPADTALMHRYLLKFPNAKIDFIPDMTIEHLEVTSVKGWLQKIYSRPKHNWLLSKELGLRYSPLHGRLKWQINRFCNKQHHYSLRQSICALFWLLWGDVVYRLGYFKKIS